MRILRVAQKTYPDVKGGGAYHVHAMSRDQAAMGHDVTVVTVRHDSSLPSVEERNGYTVMRYDPTVSPLGNDISTGMVRYLASAEGFDVIHAHSHLYFATNLAALKRRVGDVPLAITNHGLYSQTAPKQVFDVYLRTLGRWTFNRADVVFTYTVPERQALRDVGVTSDIEVVANGIDTDRFTPDGPTDDRLDSPAVLFVGRLIDGKRPVDAVRALKRILEDGIDVTLYVAGTGPLKSEMQQVAVENGSDDSVVFLGHVPYDDMPDVYRAADVLVLPSRDEGLPRTVLEAMAAGTPVVASELDQLQPVLDSHGHTVPVGDVDGFAAAITRTLASLSDAEVENWMNERLLPDGYEWSGTVEETTRQLESLVIRDTRVP